MVLPATSPKLWLLLAGAVALPAASTVRAAAPPQGRAEHVVIVVWDGMRPDFVSEEHTPTLAKMAGEGVTFANNHAVYPTTTEVNGTALATGVYPNRSGIMANREYRPDIDLLKAVGTETLAAVRKGDAGSSGKYIAVPTLPELVQAAGEQTVVAGTKPIALLWDRKDRPPDAPAAVGRSIDLYAGQTLPAGALDPILAAIGPFPTEVQFPNTDEDTWTTRALTEVLWKDGVPKLSVLWLSDPDFSQHASAPGSSLALTALQKNDDANLARVLDALTAKGVRGKTDVFVVSDHGFSTIYQSVDAVDLMNKAGIPVLREFKQAPEAGQVLYVGLGGSMAFYVIGHDPAMIQKVVDFLQQSDFAGVIFTREALPGTFALAKVHLDTAEAPDVLAAMHWNDEKSQYGVPGLIGADAGRKPGQGNHGSFSKYDVHNTLIAAGPDFQGGRVEQKPSGNIDVAPTVASILGIPHPDFDGRCLLDASGEETLNDTWGVRDFEHLKWRQMLQFVLCGRFIYFSEGNSDPARK